MRRLPLYSWLVALAMALTVTLIVPATAHAQDPAPDQPAADGDDAAPGQPIPDPFEPVPYDPEAEDGSRGDSRVQTDRLYVDDGSVLEGTISGFEEGFFILSSTALGEVKVRPERVVRFSLARERLFYVQDQLGTESRAVIVSVGGEGEMTVREANSPEAVATELDYENIFRLSSSPIPSSEWVGTVTALASANFGNQDSIAFGLSTALTRESRNEYLEMKFEFTFVEVNKNVGKRLLAGNILYRYFFFDSLGAYALDRARDDNVAGLKFGNHLLGGITWRPIITPKTHLLFDFGLGYTFEAQAVSDVEYFTGMVGMVARHAVTVSWHGNTMAMFVWDWGNLNRFILLAHLELLFAIEDTFSLGFRVEEYWQGLAPVGFRRNELRMLAVIKMEIR